MAQNKRLLIVEDDLNLTLALYRALSHTYKVITAKSGLSGLNKAKTMPFDLIILDLNLPDIAGHKITRQLRDSGINTPILILSGEAGLISKVELLDSGANDYVTKPFSLAELKARIRNLLRQNTFPLHSVLVSDTLVLNPNNRQVTLDGNNIYLRKKEFLILECLMLNSGNAVSRAYLHSYVWGEQTAISNNSIDVHIKSLRVKLYPYPNFIKTVHGLGYCFNTSKPKVRV